MPESSNRGTNGESPPQTCRPSRWRLAAIGVEFFSPIIGGSVVGYYIDQYFHTGSIWTLIGLLGGVFIAFHRLIIEVREFQRNLTK